MSTTKFLNKILVKMIIKELLDDVFCRTFINYNYIFDKEYESIQIKAVLKKQNRVVEKYYKFYIRNWVNLINNYDYLKRDITRELIENIDKNK